MESGVQLSGSEHTAEAEASEGSLRGLSGPRTPSPQRRSSPGRGRSPRRGPSPACSDSSVLTLIHSALHKRQLQVQVRKDRSFLGEGLGQPRGGARILRWSLSILGGAKVLERGLGSPGVELVSWGRGQGLGGGA